MIKCYLVPRTLAGNSFPTRLLVDIDKNDLFVKKKIALIQNIIVDKKHYLFKQYQRGRNKKLQLFNGIWRDENTF